MSDSLSQTVILIVDDNPANLSVLANQLVQHGFEVLAARSGESGLEKATFALPDLILLDIALPGIDGFEVCRRLKSDERTKNIPVIFMTVYTDTDHKMQGFEVGGVDYITKPFQEMEVMARVRTHLALSELTDHLEQKVHERTQELDQANHQLKEEILERQKIEQKLYSLNEELERRVEERTQELEDANIELRQTVETLQNTQQELIRIEKMGVLGQLVAGIAHEINTPIGVGVTAASHLNLKSRELSKQYHANTMKRTDLEKYLNMTLKSSDMILGNLEQVADQIKRFKQVAVDQTASEKRRFSLCEYIDTVLLSLHSAITSASCSVRMSCPQDLMLYSYPAALSQILTHLIMNSLIHGFSEESKSRRTITLNVTQEGRTLRIHYHDNGRGMSQEEAEHLFEPFYTTRRNRGGTGLGLYIVYNLVTQKLKGQIECDTQPGQGTTFLMRIPQKGSETRDETAHKTY